MIVVSMLASHLDVSSLNPNYPKVLNVRLLTLYHFVFFRRTHSEWKNTSQTF